MCERKHRFILGPLERPLPASECVLRAVSLRACSVTSHSCCFPCRLAIQAVVLHSKCVGTHLLSTFASNWELARRLSLMLPGTPLDYDIHCFAPYYPHDKATCDAHTAHGRTCGGACFFPEDPVFRFVKQKYLCVVNRHTKVHFVIRVALMAAKDSGVSVTTLEAAAALVSAVRAFSTWSLRGALSGLCARLFRVGSSAPMAPSPSPAASNKASRDDVKLD